VSRTLEGFQKFKVFAEMRMPLSQKDFIGNRSENGKAQFFAGTPSERAGKSVLLQLARYMWMRTWV
jgi:hypothetical protein